MPFIADYAKHLEEMTARGESIADIDTSSLSRDRIKILRRMQAGLSAGTVARAVEMSGAVEVKTVTQARRAPRARHSKNASICSCSNCRRGMESLCLLDR